MKLLVISIISLFIQEAASLKDDNNYTLFSHKENFYILKEKSILKYVDSKWITIPHNLNYGSYAFDPLITESKTYLVSKGLGKVLEFKNDSIYELDKSTFWRAKYESFNFFRDEQIFSFGGYGFYTYRKDLLHFDFKNKEWFNYKINDLNSPPPSSIGNGYYDDVNEIIYLGLGLNDDVSLNELYTYDFKNESWKNIGTINVDLSSGIKTSNYHDYLIINDNQVFSINYKNLTYKKHQSQFLDLAAIRQIHYNKITGEFIITRQKSTSKKLDIQILDEEDIISPWDYIAVGFNLKDESNHIYLILLGLVIGVCIFYVILKPKKKTILYIKKNLGVIQNGLSEVDIIFLDLIIEQYPQPIKYIEFMNLLDASLAYETKVKKVRESINRIELKLTRALRSTKKTVLTSKNIDDNRIKQVTLQIEK